MSNYTTCMLEMVRNQNSVFIQSSQIFHFFLNALSTKIIQFGDTDFILWQLMATTAEDPTGYHSETFRLYFISII